MLAAALMAVAARMPQIIADLEFPAATVPEQLDDDRRRSKARAHPMPDGHAFLADAGDKGGWDHHASVAGR